MILFANSSSACTSSCPPIQLNGFTVHLEIVSGSKVSDIARTAIEDSNSVAYLGEALEAAGVPLVVLTGSNDESLAEQALHVLALTYVGEQLDAAASYFFALGQMENTDDPCPTDWQCAAEASAYFFTANADAWRRSYRVIFVFDTASFLPYNQPRLQRLDGHVVYLTSPPWGSLANQPGHSLPQLERLRPGTGGLHGLVFWVETGTVSLAGARQRPTFGARPLAGASQLLCTSVDGFISGTPVQVVLDGRNALLTVARNGQALPVAHGFPARMVVPGLYGYVSACKWVTDIEVTRFSSAYAYWATRGWSQQAPIKTESRIDVPVGNATIAPGRTPVAGVAWAQHKGVAAVEVRVDAGPWQQARLAAVPDIDTWRQWVWEWDATPGTHVLQARATDATGYTQTAAQAQPPPNGASGYPSATVVVHSS